MQKVIFALLALSSGFYMSTVQAKDRVITGTISEYECGDNCYLTITDASGKAHSALCTAPLCQPWNEKAEMPARFKGKQVRATVGKGKQYDGEGHAMGTMDAFKKLDLVK